MCKHGKLWPCVYQCGAMQLMLGIMQIYCSPWHLRIPDFIPRTNVTSYYASCATHHCLVHMKSFNMSFVFCSASAVFSASLHASMSAALPTGFWFMNPILVCHYRLQKGALMDQYVESVSRRIALCPQISWIFFWQPVACSISDLDDTRWCIKLLQEILGDFIL